MTNESSIASDTRRPDESPIAVDTPMPNVSPAADEPQMAEDEYPDLKYCLEGEAANRAGVPREANPYQYHSPRVGADGLWLKGWLFEQDKRRDYGDEYEEIVEAESAGDGSKTTGMTDDEIPSSACVLTSTLTATTDTLGAPLAPRPGIPPRPMLRRRPVAAAARAPEVTKMPLDNDGPF